MDETLTLRAVARHLLPGGVSRRLSDWERARKFRRALRRIADRVSQGEVSPVDLDDLRQGWGNLGWSADRELMTECLELGMEAEFPILDCGSGLSTHLLAVAAAPRGIPVVALEHDPLWAKKVQKSLRDCGLTNARVYLAPLRSHGDYTWYEPPAVAMEHRYGLVICDGPPGDTRGGRFGLMPIMERTLRPGCLVVLDDCERKGELDVLRHWMKGWRMSLDWSEPSRGIARLSFEAEKAGERD